MGRAVLQGEASCAETASVPEVHCQPDEEDSLMSSTPISGVSLLAEVQWEDDDEGALVREMESLARRYLLEHRWCLSVRRVRVGFAVGKVVAVFLVEIEAKPEVDDCLWVVVGDLPSAYFVTDNTRNSCDAIEAYCELMDAWIDAVRTHGRLDAVFPVAAAPTLEHADMLASRIESLRSICLPACRADPGLA